MPKLLVLVPARGIELAPLADAVLEGARSVRFAEVDVRTLDDGADATSNRKPLAAIDDLASYDGIVVGAPAGDVDGTAVRETLARFGGSLANKVGSAFTTGSGAGRTAVLWSALSPMADRGMILVPLPFADDGASTDACRQMGKRVAEVIGWVTHARSHHHHH
jgi:multimeric flavodoxin WrbA